jgi:hypothetical protein
LRWREGGIRRAVIAGSAWGIATAIGLVGLVAWECGGICLSDAAATVAFAVPTGILAVGPLAAWTVARPDAI